MAKIPTGLKLMKDGNVGLEMNPESMGYFNITVASIREIVHDNLIVSGPGVDTKYMPTSDELGIMLDMAKHAIQMGQIIDFGYWPNDMIMNTGHRAGRLYAEGALGHPFSTPYIILHTWDDPKMQMFQEEYGKDKSSCAYLINPFPGSNSKNLCIDFEAMCFEGLVVPKHGGMKCLGVGDRALLIGNESQKSKTYACHVVPFALRWPELLDRQSEFARMATNRQGDDYITAAAGNVMDPIMTALLMLNTRGIGQEIVNAPTKLNKARLKSNKPPIPPYRKVDSTNYVTVIMNRLNRPRGPGTGTHASPVMHMRQGHWRHYATGERSFIRDTLVNATPEQRATFVMGRSHYTIKE